MANDRADEQIQLNRGAENDASVRLLAEVMPDRKRVVTANDSPVQQVERVMEEVELSVVKASGGKLPAGERDLLIQWGQDSIRDALQDIKLKLEPTPEEKDKARTDANEHLENNDFYKLLSKSDQQALAKMQDAILNGDTKALAELAKQYKGDPDKLDAIGHVIEKNLKEMGARVQIDVTDGGKLLIYDKYGRHAAEVSPDGKVAVRSVQVNLDGSVEVMEDRQVLRPKANDVIKGIADSAVFDVTHPHFKLPPIGFPGGAPSGRFPPGGFPPGIPGGTGSSGGFPPGGHFPIVPGDPGTTRVPLYQPKLYQI